MPFLTIFLYMSPKDMHRNTPGNRFHSKYPETLFKLIQIYCTTEKTVLEWLISERFYILHDFSIIVYLLR